MYRLEYQPVPSFGFDPYLQDFTPTVCRGKCERENLETALPGLLTCRENQTTCENDQRVLQRSKLPYPAYADAMRATAIAAVVLCHLSFPTAPVIKHPSSLFAYPGDWGVNCFFVLSGLLLGNPYCVAILDGSPLPALGTFYRRRFYRIYPAYLAAVILSIPLAFAASGRLPYAKDIVAHVFLLQTLSVKTALSLNGPLWTMGIDASFYLALPLLAGGFAQIVRRKSRTLVFGTILSSLIVLGLASIIYRFIALTVHPEAISDFSIATVYVRNLFGFTFSFGVGLALTLLMASRSSISRRAAFCVIATGAALAAVEMASGDGIVGVFFHVILRSRVIDEHATRLTANTLLDPLAAISSGLILFGLMQFESRKALAFVRNDLVVRIAASAYAVYLIHYPVIEIVERYLVNGRLGNLAFIELSGISMMIVIPLAIMLHRFVEEPFLSLNARDRASITVRNAPGYRYDSAS